MTGLFFHLLKLERLELSGLSQKFRDACLKKLPQNTLKELSLISEESDYYCPESSIQITRAGAIGIQNMKNLWKLEFTGFSFKADKLKLIVCNESITYLSLKNCYFEKCINLIENFRGLKYLNLSNVDAVDDTFLIKLAANCTELEELNIENCTDVTNDGINAVFKLKKLTTLIINDLDEVTDTVLSKFVALKVLHCKNCNFVRDFGAIELLQNAPYLEEINLCGTSVSTSLLDIAHNVAISRANAIPLKIIVSSTLESEWNRPPSISKSVLVVEAQDDDNLWNSYWDDPELSDSCNSYDEDEIDDYDDYVCWGWYDSDEDSIEGFINY
ncbi:hypothetical protein PV326_000220 [Microctonus aethiopoides]|nr:hypothetical protein PV326_000220 [Microctonus aethiopoides]